MGGVGYAYLAYPVLVWAAARAFGRDAIPPRPPGAMPPRVALLIVAHNEATVIGDRIEDALALAYPPDRLRVVIVSDGSDDGTDDICRAHAGRVTLVAFPGRRGKAAALAEAVARLDDDVLVLSDANTLMDPRAIANLARWFADPGIGVVCGRLVITDRLTGRNADGLYWRYETHLKRCEARLGALLGANGAIYAIRRTSFPPLPPSTAVDDFVVPLLARLRTGCRIVYDADAVAHVSRRPTCAASSAAARASARAGSGPWRPRGPCWRRATAGWRWRSGRTRFCGGSARS